MIIICPSCQTRFQIDEAALRRPDGRLVRCANCGHSWRQQSLEPAAPLRAEPEPPPLFSAGEARAPVLAADQQEGAPPPKPTSRPWPAVAAVLAIVLVGAALLVGFGERHSIVTMYRAAVAFYARVRPPGQQPEQSSAVLKIDHIKPQRTGGGLVIEGEVSNSGKTAHELPSLRVALEDSAQKEVQFKIIPPPKERLEPGESAHFTTPIEHPATAAKDVVVTFASR